MFTEPLSINARFYWLHSSGFRRYVWHSQQGDLLSFLLFLSK
jgi:hypothetical protein